jgi:hypothetical protein
LIDINTKFNLANVPQFSRSIALSPYMEGDLLGVQLFTDASQAGDGGKTQRRGVIGDKFGSVIRMSQNMYNIPTGSAGTATTGAINNGAGYAIGTTTMTVSGFSGQLTPGSWLTIAGDARPRRLESCTGSPNTTSITLETAIEAAVVNTAVVTAYPVGAVNGALAQYYDKRLVVDTFSTTAPARGQMVSVTATGAKYGVIGYKNSLTSLKFDRGLDAAASNDAGLFAGPVGDFGMAYHRNAIAFVSRPPATDELMGPGAPTMAVVSRDGLSLRVTMWYNGTTQGWQVTVDLLCGIKVLDENLGILICR